MPLCVFVSLSNPKPKIVWLFVPPTASSSRTFPTSPHQPQAHNTPSSQQPSQPKPVMTKEEEEAAVDTAEETEDEMRKRHKSEVRVSCSKGGGLGGGGNEGEGQVEGGGWVGAWRLMLAYNEYRDMQRGAMLEGVQARAFPVCIPTAPHSSPPSLPLLRPPLPSLYVATRRANAGHAEEGPQAQESRGSGRGGKDGEGNGGAARKGADAVGGRVREGGKEGREREA